MASFAIGRELGRNVVRIVCLRKVRLVAGVARRGHDLELTGRPAFVAGVAIDRSMSASQRESVVMLLYVFNRNLPAPNRMALLAISSELPFVDIGMAVLTTFPDIRKDHLYVAGSAGYRRVHPSQGVARLVMIELRHGSNRPPAIRGMAVLAGKCQGPVWTMCTFGGLRSCTYRKSGKCQNHDENEFRCNPSAHALHLAFVLLNP